MTVKTIKVSEIKRWAESTKINLFNYKERYRARRYMYIAEEWNEREKLFWMEQL